MIDLYEIAEIARIIMYGVIAPCAVILAFVFWRQKQWAMAFAFVFISFIVILQQYGLMLIRDGGVNRQVLLVNTLFWFGLTVSVVSAATVHIVEWLRIVCSACVDKWLSFRVGE